MAAHGFERLKRRILAARDHDLFFGADNQIAIGQNRLQMRRHIAGFDIALFTRTMAREPPEIGAVININRDFATVLFCILHRELLGGCRVGFGKMGAGDDYRARRGDKGLVNIALVQCIVGAIVTVKNQRKLFVIADA